MGDVIGKMKKVLGGQPVADDGAQTARAGIKKDVSSNLGKFLHPKKDANKTVGASVAGGNVRATQ